MKKKLHVAVEPTQVIAFLLEGSVIVKVYVVTHSGVETGGIV